MAGPQLNAPLVPHFAVTINGTPLSSDVLAHVAAISVDEQVELPAMCTLELTGSDAQRSLALWVDDARLDIGGAIEISLGYIADVEVVFRGEITGLEPRFDTSVIPSVTVRGYDRLHRLQRGRKTRTFVQQKDSDIAAQIAASAALTARVAESGPTHEYVLQSNQTDFDFLWSRARRCFFEMAVDDKTLLFRPVGNDRSAARTLSMGEDLLRFSARLSSGGQATEVAARGWSVKDKAAIVGLARVGDEHATMGGRASAAVIAREAFDDAARAITSTPVSTQAEADQIALASFNSGALSFVLGDGVCLGRTDVRAGRVIRLVGLGARFSGQYYVTGVVHRYESVYGYQTHFTVRRNAS